MGPLLATTDSRQLNVSKQTEKQQKGKKSPLSCFYRLVLVAWALI
jgi:hypothetical protein